MGGVSALAYLTTVSRDMPSSLAMARRDRHRLLACCTATRRARWVEVGVRCSWWRTGFAWLAAFLALARFSTDDSRAARSFRWSRSRCPLASSSAASVPSPVGKVPLPSPHKAGVRSASSWKSTASPWYRIISSPSARSIRSTLRPA